MNHKLIYLSCLILPLIVSSGFAQSSTAANPVVISYGDVELTRRQFELDFEMLMVINAVQTGVPVKDRQQIVAMQSRYLDQRAHEIVLLDVAEKRNISASERELESDLDEFMISLGFTSYNSRNLLKLGIDDEQHFRNYLAEKLIMSKLISRLEQELQGEDRLGQQLAEIYKKSGIETFPERLRSRYLGG